MSGEPAARIGVVGDHDPAVVAHRANPLVVERVAEVVGFPIEATWVATDSIDPADPAPRVGTFDGIWVVPNSPYASDAGVFASIRWARESGTPFLGTCGGFQYAVVEYARNVLGLDAGHEELDPLTALPLIGRMACALVEERGTIRIVPGTRVAELLGASEIDEGYHCSFGVDPRHENLLADGRLVVAGRDPAGEVRIIELRGHPFWLITQFQPERAGLEGRSHPLIEGFARAARDRGSHFVHGQAPDSMSA